MARPSSALLSLIAVAAAALTGCVHYFELQPAPTAQLVQGAKDTAFAESDGIRVVVDGEPWRGDPSDLGTLVTPLRISIEWAGPFDYDPSYYSTYYTQWQAPLPTRDMLQKALPEGVLNANGEVTGYLYFQPIPTSVSQVTFDATLVNASDGAILGRVSIPFVVKH